MPPKPKRMPYKKRAVANPRLAILRKRVASAPTEPGVYRWLNEEGTVLYVGKAKNLRNRLRSYVSQENATGPWKQSFREQIADFDVSVTNTELEALIFETNLIKELRPKYNVLMKDDKNYVYARVTVQDPFPRVEAVRRIAEDGAKYFGPMATGGELMAQITMLRSVFPFRVCSMEIVPAPTPSPLSPSPLTPLPQGEGNAALRFSPSPGGGRGRGMREEGEESGVRVALEVECKYKDRPTPCLDYHIQKCVAPCIGTRTPEQYFKECIEGVVRFLKGDYESVRPLFEERMKKAALEKKFELAALLRDYLQSLGRLAGKQLITDTSGEDSDIIAVAVLSGRADVVVMHRRNGRLIGDVSFSLAGQAEDAAEVLEQFLPQYYAEGAEIPETVIVSEVIPDRKILEEWFSQKKGKKVKILVPERGKKSHLLQLAEKNVREKAKQREIKWEAEKRNTESALADLQTLLSLPGEPHRIEGYDISHLGGTETVGSMVVMVGGKARNDQYRSFTLRSLKAGEVDDYKSLKEVLRRRLRHVTGGLKGELDMLKKEGIAIRKSRKADRDGIEALIKTNPHMRTDDLDEGAFFVAARGNAVVACCRLFDYPTKLRELRSMCVAETERGKHLGHSLIRAALGTQKRGKTYVVIDPALEQYYAEMGFRHIFKVPPVLARRIKRLLTRHPKLPQPLVMMFDASQHKTDASLQAKPDLLVIDGGKGQLGAVRDVLKELKLKIPAIGLAKREEEVFSGGKFPLSFPKDSQAKFLLMRLRDEAHRFANRHREARGKKTSQASILDEIPSIGDETRKKLLRKFGSLSAIRSAKDEELLEVLSEGQVREVRRHLS